MNRGRTFKAGPCIVDSISWW